MKSVLKYGIVGGLILAFGLKFLAENHFPGFVLTIILYPGGMMFTVNDFLLTPTNRVKFSYLFGVFLSAGFAVLSLFLCHLIWLFLIWDFEVVRTMQYFINALWSNTPFLLAAAFGVPLIFYYDNNDEEPEKKSKDEFHSDILDEEL